jgi:hypothetical protein
MSLTPRQKQVLDLLREMFHGEMDAEARNYRRIADRVGWQENSSVRFTLYCLRAKGAVRSIGSSSVSPERWVAR